MSSLKGQSANELLVIYMFVMLMFTIFVASFSQQRSAEMMNSQIAAADSVGERFANELNLAARSGSGYSRKVVYPALLGGTTPYTIIMNNLSKSVDIQFSLGTVNYSHSFPIITSSVMVVPRINATLPNGTAYGYVLQSSNTTISQGQVYAQNLNGMIVISLAPSYPPTPRKITMAIAGSYVETGAMLSNITATVTDTFGNNVPDGTLIHFSTPSGVVDDFAPTVNGTATAVLISQTTTIVTASVSGVSDMIFVALN
jgi:hypothetical protein